MEDNHQQPREPVMTTLALVSVVMIGLAWLLVGAEGCKDKREAFPPLVEGATCGEYNQQFETHDGRIVDMRKCSYRDSLGVVREYTETQCDKGVNQGKYACRVHSLD